MLGEALSYRKGYPKRLINRVLDLKDCNLNIRKSFSFFMLFFIGVSALFVLRYIVSHVSLSGVASTLRV